MKKAKNIDFLTSTLIAHRGIHDDIVPENSLTAFQKAAEGGYIIELDVHLVDGEIVVFHDDNVRRMTGKDKAIKDFTRDDLFELRLKNTEERIPKLVEVFDLVQDKVPIIIEVKYDVPAKEICPTLLKVLADYTGRFVIQSFDPRILHYFKCHANYIGRGQLATNNNFFMKNLGFNFWVKPDFISYDIRQLPSRRIENVRHKIPVLGWTIHSKKELATAKRYCDGYICEGFLG